MIHFYLSSYLKRTGAHFGVGISSPFDYSKNPSVVKKYGERKARKLKSKGFVLVQLQDERAEQVRRGLTPDEARHMADELASSCRRGGGKARKIGDAQGNAKQTQAVTGALACSVRQSEEQPLPTRRLTTQPSTRHTIWSARSKSRLRRQASLAILPTFGAFTPSVQGCGNQLLA